MTQKLKKLVLQYTGINHHSLKIKCTVLVISYSHVYEFICLSILLTMYIYANIVCVCYNTHNAYVCLYSI